MAATGDPQHPFTLMDVPVAEGAAQATVTPDSSPPPDPAGTEATYVRLSGMTKALALGIRKYLQQLGRKGGQIGGKRSLETLTPEQRSARARKAGIASGLARKKPTENP